MTVCPLICPASNIQILGPLFPQRFLVLHPPLPPPPQYHIGIPPKPNPPRTEYGTEHSRPPAPLQIPANLLLVKNMTVHGIFWGSYLQAQPRALLEGMAQVLKWLSEGKLEVQVGGMGAGVAAVWQMRCYALCPPLTLRYGIAHHLNTVCPSGVPSLPHGAC